jgi:hypothetical protein
MNRRQLLIGAVVVPLGLRFPPEPKKDLNQDIRRLILAAHRHCPQCDGRRELLGQVGSRRLRCPKCEGYDGPFVHEDPYDRFLRELREQVVRRLEGQDGRLERLWIDPMEDGRRLVHLRTSGGDITFYQYYGG